MTNKSKQNLRYTQASRRIFEKRLYPSNPVARLLCQLDEQRERLSKSISRQFEAMESKGFVSGKDNQNPAYFVDFDLINVWMKEQDKIAFKVARLEEKSGITTTQALKDFHTMNKGRGSQSF